MKRFLLIGLLFLAVNIVGSTLVYFFVLPKILTIPFFAKYQIEHNSNKPIIINKTEKITVKENFSLRKTAERIMPAVVRVYFLPESNKNVNKKFILNTLSASGVIVSSDGIIVTVLPDVPLENKKIKIALENGKSFMAKIIKKDKYNGLLLLKIDADNLPVAHFGESSKVQNGEKLVLGGRATSTMKEIFSLRIIQEVSSNFNRKGLNFLFSEENSKVFFLDNSINSQFIGGPAIDFNGTMVGIINQLKLSDKEIFYVIPFNNIKNMLNNFFKKNLEKNKKEINQKGINKTIKLGVYYINIDKELSLLNNLPVNSGALIYSPSGKSGLTILSNSPAKKAGLKVGDIIISINNENITQGNTLASVLAKYNFNDKITLTIFRNNKKKQLIINL